MEELKKKTITMEGCNLAIIEKSGVGKSSQIIYLLLN
jgi:tRNA U34 5-carboxymethylaminomethyl modifying GTPase MnmE/TrmE